MQCSNYLLRSDAAGVVRESNLAVPGMHLPLPGMCVICFANTQRIVHALQACSLTANWRYLCPLLCRLWSVACLVFPRSVVELFASDARLICRLCLGRGLCVSRTVYEGHGAPPGLSNRAWNRLGAHTNIISFGQHAYAHRAAAVAILNNDQ